jgi:ribosomal peptide maturation radical SAM protein 1
VDLVVAGDGEVVFPELVRRLAGGEPLDGLPGVHRRSAGEVVAGPSSPPVRPDAVRTLLDFDPYFERLRRLDLTGRFEVWLPFEGSRGCWYGEKAQCTFCGLHEIMKFRSSGHARVLAQLDDLYRRYGIGRFFSVDLILPREFMDTLLPELAGRGADWTIFYETKADLRREQLALMAAAGIRWIQPGIESLDADLLRLMRKGVRPSHNVQLLRWCQELGVQVSWNLLTGIPGSRPEMYDGMAALLPLLHHLPPPTGVGDFQLHRFSPYWQTPEAYGIEVLGAHPLFRHVFPLPDRELDDLVYWLDFRLPDGTGCGEAGRRLAVAAHDWLRAYRDGAELTLTATEDGSVIEDRRRAVALRYELTSAETALYLLLTTALRRAVIPAELARAYPGARPDQTTIDKTIAGWAECGLVYVEQDRVLALATGAAADRPHREAPLGYLE